MVSLIRSVCNYAYKNSLISKSIIVNTDDLKKSEQKISLSLENWDLLKNTVSKVKIKSIDNVLFKNILILLLNTGCRIEEVLTLTKDRVFLNTKESYFFLPKSLTKGKKDRYVPIFGDCFKAIEFLIENSTTESIISMNYNNIRVALGKYCIESDINVITPHIFRHTFITWAIRGDFPWQNGIPMNKDILQLIVGHSKGSEITNNYTHLDLKDIFKSINN